MRCKAWSRSGAGHGEALWRLAALAALPHGGIGRLDVAREPSGVEERTSLAVAHELLPHSGETPGIARERQRQRLILFERMRDQLRQPDRAQQAPRNPAREGLPRMRQDR